ncbi:MAG: hypothetical protein HOG49_21630 [Candidatus Scalindua sp.]|jgi:hypothetical protein|nr:hypothetical protein [Candidatus Scalindua sp.]
MSFTTAELLQYQRKIHRKADIEEEKKAAKLAKKKVPFKNNINSAVARNSIANNQRSGLVDEVIEEVAEAVVEAVVETVAEAASPEIDFSDFDSDD